MALATRASANVAELGGRLNKITGYDAIEQLKHSVVEREQQIAAFRQEARDAKRAYEQAVAERSSCQREVNEALQRKSFWNESDVGRFTALVRQDHLNEQEEVRAKQRVDAAELKVESEFGELMRTILNRYHEEQIWSDKIRGVSTYGSLAVLGINVFIFILAIVVVEPWKRKRLGETFEKRMMVMEKENQELMSMGMRDLREHFEKQEEVLAGLSAIALKPVDHQLSHLPKTLPEVEEMVQEVDAPIRNITRTFDAIPHPRVASAALGAVGGMVVMYLIGR